MERRTISDGSNLASTGETKASIPCQESVGWYSQCENPHPMTIDPIVITGVGALSPNGIGREPYFAAMAGGRSGIRTITQFDPGSLPCRIAGEVDFDP